MKKLPSFAAFDILFAASEPEYQTGKEKNKTDSFLVQAFYCNHFKAIHYIIVKLRVRVRVRVKVKVKSQKSKIDPEVGVVMGNGLHFR